MKSSLPLLMALDALLAEESVSGAARRLGLSSPSASRALARLRKELGDPLLVRAGRRLVPTPRALALRGRVRDLVERADDLFRQEAPPDRAAWRRSFAIRANEVFPGACAARLVGRVTAEAPGVALRFLPEGDEDAESLRVGLVELHIGPPGAMGPEIRTQRLFADEFVGVVDPGHPLATGPITPGRFAGYPHVSVSRRGRSTGPIDDALGELGLARTVALTVASVHAALFAVAGPAQLVAAVPGGISAAAVRRLGLHAFPLPVPTPPIEVHQCWHPRFDVDPAHRWLRQRIREVAQACCPSPGGGEAP